MIFLLCFLSFFGLTILLIFATQGKKSPQGKAAETARERCQRILADPALQAPRNDTR